MSKSQEHVALCKDDVLGEENPAYDPSYATIGDRDAVTFSPTCDQVAFGQLPPYTDDRRTTGLLNCGDKRMKWIAVIVSVVAVCLLIIILGCVFMIHVHPTLGNKVDTCTRAQCQHGATCVDGTSYFNCVCPSGYTGLLCEVDIDECGSSPCADGAATCRDAVNGYVCDCRPGFEGTLCETDIDECARSPCVEGAATCLDGVNNFTCQCAAGYAGRYCELNVQECASSPCANSATCHDGINGYVCQCDGGYTGRHCEGDINECLSNPCANGATCHDDVSWYSCQCQLGYTGSHCEADIDECSSSPCVNGATCHDGVNSHYCQCDDGFTGRYCETDHDECLSLPCFHGGTCIDGTNYYMCECLPGYTGQHCEIDVDECWSQPCQHGANCVNALNMYFCLCEPGFSGQHCEAVQGTCPTGFIEYQDDGRCYFLEEDSSNQLTYDNAQGVCQIKNSSLVSLETSAETEAVGSHFTWEGRYHVVGARRKPDGNLYWNSGQILHGTHPEWSSDEPKSNKDCVAAIMRDGDTKLYSLECSNARPYVCERSMIYPPGISDCRIRPCMNGATCQNVTGGFYCACTPSFTGRYCTEDINECASEPCLNGATCRDGFGQYTCVCAPGYSGPRCQTDIDDCASQPCNVNATCIDGINSFSCLCPVNRTGPKCNAGVDDPCPPQFVFYPDEARCYLVKEESSDEVDWRVAETNCDAHGATLASLESPTEVDFVGGLFNRQGRYHIVSARKESGIFRWNTGVELPTNHPKWKSGQPSYEDCVAIINSDGVSSLYTMGCSYDRPYVCEMAMLLPPGVNDCRSMPCRNGAECHTINNNDHYCNCTTGFTGSQCETDLDECAAQPCENNGTCSNTPGAYSCQCIAGFTGLHCERDILECASDPCQNNGTCLEGINSYTCECPGNYTGPHCQTHPDDPCPHDFFYYPQQARCYFLEEDRDRQKTATEAEVVCASKDSELASLETVAEVQFVGAHYTWTGRYHLVGARRRADNIIYWNSGQVLRDTFPKWSSGQPSSYIDCVSTIMNGNNTNLYSLECSNARPFVCERPIRLPPGVHSCVSMPCLHGATCVDGNNTYTCECPAGFTGDRCETDIDECASAPCVNAGTCVQGWGYYTCQCVAGYTGENCETETQECDSDPCLNNGTCVDGINSFTCQCAGNFTGTICAASADDRCPLGFIHWVEEARCYFLEEDSSRQKTYNDAQQICAGKGADLASLSTDAELQFVGSRFTWSGRYHVMGARRGSDNIFRWNDGSVLPLTHPRWSRGEPGTSKECVAVIMENSVSKLYGLSCSYARPYVCERGVM